MRYPAGGSRGPPAEGLERHRSDTFCQWRARTGFLDCCVLFLVVRSDQPPRRASDVALRGRAEVRGVPSEGNEALHARV
eukprot:8961728-Pyramimonas_sp.AAC.1